MAQAVGSASDAGLIKDRGDVRPCIHEGLISKKLFDAIQAITNRNSGRSETLNPRPARQYVLKGLVRCTHCGLPMWAQANKKR